MDHVLLGCRPERRLALLPGCLADCLPMRDRRAGQVI
jgi:hypothetical protein